jgi:Putative beta-barrel porin 2
MQAYNVGIVLMKFVQLMISLLLGLMLILGVLAGTAAADEAPMGSTGERSATEIFGARKGNWHPSLSVSQSWTDNLFNVPVNKDAESITVVTPALWLAFPARFDQPETLQTVNAAPGSLAYSVLKDTTDYGIYQVYAAYSANFESYWQFSDKNQTTQRTEAKLGFYPGAKTRIELQHIFDNNREAFGSGTSTSGQEDFFTGNTSILSMSYMLTSRLNLKASGGHYSLRYADASNDFRERDDWTLAGQVGFAVTPKIDLLAEFKRIDINYPGNGELDSEENHVAAGIEWAVTEKTNGLAKIGYNSKNLTGTAPDVDDMDLELQLNYQFSSKTKLTLRGLRQLNETDFAGTSNRLTYQAGADLAYHLTAKMTTGIDLSWVRDLYHGAISIGTLTAEREDDYLQAGVSVNWRARRWLTVGCGYALAERDSNFDTFDYTSNTAYLNFSAEL